MLYINLKLYLINLKLITKLCWVVDLDQGWVNLLVPASGEYLPRNILHTVHSVAPTNLDEDLELQEPGVEAGMQQAVGPGVETGMEEAVKQTVKQAVNQAVKQAVDDTDHEADDAAVADHAAADHVAADHAEAPHK